MDRKRFGRAAVVALTLLVAAGVAGADEPLFDGDTATLTLDQMEQGDAGQVSVSQDGEATDASTPDELTLDVQSLDGAPVDEGALEMMTASARPAAEQAVSAAPASGDGVVAASEGDDRVDCTLLAQRQQNILCK